MPILEPVIDDKWQYNRKMIRNGFKMNFKPLHSFAVFFFSIVLISYLFNNGVLGEAAKLSSDNIDVTLASNEFVIINFYAEWCRFSNMLQPIFDEAADKIKEHFPDSGRVLFAKVDCDKESSIATRFHITKYPTLKVIRNGQPAKREYRGQRAVDAFVEYVKKQMSDPIKEFTSLNEIQEFDKKARVVIGYFHRKDSPEYEIFRRVASTLKDDCQFHVGFGDIVQAMHPPEQPIVVFRPDHSTPETEHETYNGSLTLYDELNIWITDKCVPLVREITFENAEELTEEGLPFLILFHKPDDVETVKQFKEIVMQELISEKQNINFLTADGERFAHPLLHLGKKQEDLPLIAIDSFRHMYLFPKIEHMRVPNKLKEFIQDLYSGKLHREFHFGPDSGSPAETIHVQISQDGNIINSGGEGTKEITTPPESTFKKLAPSDKRYTLLKRDEL